MGKKNSKPKIDIIIPNYNKGNYIDQAIMSVINQTYKNWQLFVIDDNSDDDSKKILKKYKNNKKIKIIYLKKNKGPGFCRNIGIAKSKSNFVAFLDSDDYWEINKLFFQLKFMIKYKLEFTYTDYISFYQNGKKIKKIGLTRTPKNFTFNSFIKNTSINTSTLILKKNILKKSRFRNLKKHEDYIFKCEIFRKNKDLKAVKFDKTFAYYRVLKESRSQNKLVSIFYLWKYNKEFNKLSFVKNLFSIVFVSFNSLKKYGFKKGV